MSELKNRINEDVKSAMRNKDKERLATLRLITAAIKQKEVDERIEMDDAAVLAVLDKMVKQRKDSIEQYTKADRPELADKEQAEILIIQEYLPAQLSDAEIDAMIDEAISDTGASGMKEMGKVMGILKPKLQGRADMGAVSGKIKAKEFLKTLVRTSRVLKRDVFSFTWLRCFRGMDSARLASKTIKSSYRVFQSIRYQIGSEFLIISRGFCQC